MRKWRNERGAVAVEFALLLPLLVTLLIGIMEFGMFYSAQISVTAAAREAARVMAIGNDPAAARTAARAASPVLDPALTDTQIAISGACVSGATAKITISYSLPALTGLFGPSFGITGRAAMRCGG
ncbi:pilus assembly protein [Cryobacterium sp. SO2]|uniref:TadE/TadG family type IV pilus assembly protein n=1 Tax=Cryobacterium sp. SO2 TaxID=1897060 RepID=UPI00223D24A6|nr:TadE family protein [Cryobacterium sp. SO2]WEO78007.1 pilus assembly protein [Cryobacterium sp. SO2]